MHCGDEKLKQALAGCTSIAIVGAKDKSGSAVDSVGRYMIAAGFTVYPVHPVRSNVWGLTTYKTLGGIPHPVDLVNLFRAPQFCPDHARETLALPTLPKVFWMQLGIVSFDARAILSSAPIAVFEDLCLMVEHRRLCRAA